MHLRIIGRWLRMRSSCALSHAPVIGPLAKFNGRCQDAPAVEEGVDGSALINLLVIVAARNGDNKVCAYDLIIDHGIVPKLH